MTNDEFYKHYLSSVKERKDWLNRNQSKITSFTKVFRDFENQRPDAIENAYSVYRNYAGYKLSPDIEVSRETIDQCLKYLKDTYSFEIIAIGSEFSYVTFYSRAIIAEKDPKLNTTFSVDLGMFETKIVFNNEIGYRPWVVSSCGTSSKPIGGNSSKCVNGYYCYHPHIAKNGVLCIGTYNLSKDATDFNILSIFQNMCNVLCRYSANSLNFPGAFISNWIGDKCPVCYEFVLKGVKCAKTHVTVHEDCAEKIGDNYYSLGVMKKCNKCGKSSPFFIAYGINNVVCSLCDSEPTTEPSSSILLEAV